MRLKRYFTVLAMLIAIGVFFAGLTIARADSDEGDGSDPTPTCQLPGNDQGDENDQGCLGTAMHAVNAIPLVCEAAPGIRTFLDLPMVLGRRSIRPR